MSDIYYCSNNKGKKSNSDSKNCSSDKSSKSHSNHHSHNNSNNNNNSSSTRDNNVVCAKHATNGKTNWNTKALQSNTNGSAQTCTTTTSTTTTSQPKIYHNARCARHQKAASLPEQQLNSSISTSSDVNHNHRHSHTHSHHSNGHRRKSESVLSTDSDIRFTRRKLGDSQKCGCAVIAGFLVALLVAGIFVYVGYTYFKPEPLPDRVFRGKFLVLSDSWTMDLADQNTFGFQQKARDYRERINLLIRRSDLREAFEGSEILALDGVDGGNDILVHFNIFFDPYAELVTTSDILALFGEEFSARTPKYFADLQIDTRSLSIKETTGIIEEPIMSSSPLGGEDETTEIIYTTTPRIPRRCELLRLNYCRGVGYNVTTYPNFLGHYSFEEVQADVIAFRELVDAECFREAFDFVCRLLQPPCDTHGELEPTAGIMCREYCESFMRGCGNRLPHRFKRYFDCETFPESTGIQSCQQKPSCANDLQTNAQSPRLCDGYADCPDASDERSCTFCAPNALYCGRGRACVPRTARCDGKPDCPDGADEKDCLSIAPLAADLVEPEPLVPYLPRFHAEGYAVFSEKGIVGKLCAEGLEGDAKLIVRQTVAESLCKSLGYESVEIYDVQNDTEYVNDYVRVLDPHAPEISFIRTQCPRRRVLFVGCGELQCGVQSVLSNKQHLTLPKMAAPGDWPWLVALYRENIHVCDGTLISRNWVLTTESCFQGQPRATWMAYFGLVRLSTKAPWTQRRRIVGLIKSPVEGSTAALIRLEAPVEYSDHVRPVCMPDEQQRRQEQQLIQRRTFNAKAEHLHGSRLGYRYTPKEMLQHETQQFFTLPSSQQKEADSAEHDASLAMPLIAEQHDFTEISQMPHAEPLKQEQPDQLNAYPVPPSAPQVQYYNTQQQQIPEHYVAQSPKTKVAGSTKSLTAPAPAKAREEIWVNCNTLGWSRQRDHLQRVQLKIGDMAPCENISIATVNSMCTEATYQKHDCTQEEYSGAPVQCLIPNTNQWALIGISSWRIACGPTGVERPRMYDKITSNTAWIRETIYAV